MSASVQIAQHTIGEEHPTYIIAEMSANHNGSFDRAVKLIEVAADTGVDAIKLQTYTADTLTLNIDKPTFRSRNPAWSQYTLHELYDRAHTPWEWQPRLKEIAERLGLDCFSSPFDATAVDFLEAMDVPAYKIASYENIDIPLLRAVACTGKPIIMSTGMATLAEIDEAVRTIRAEGNDQIALLKCTSSYPAPPEEANLRTIPHLAEAFGVVVGLSDHTHGTSVPIAAVTLGARIIEKHLTLARADGGPDSEFSLEPDEFKQLVDAVRITEKALGSVSYRPTTKERESIRFRRSLFVVEDVKEGQSFTVKNVRSIRPADGLSPKYYDQVLGSTATQDISRGTPLAWEHIHFGGS